MRTHARCYVLGTLLYDHPRLRLLFLLNVDQRHVGKAPRVLHSQQLWRFDAHRRRVQKTRPGVVQLLLYLHHPARPALRGIGEEYLE